MVSGENLIQPFVPNASCGEGGGTDGKSCTKQVPAFCAAGQAGPVLGGSAAVVDDHPERQSGGSRAVRIRWSLCPLFRGSSACRKKLPPAEPGMVAERRSPQPSRFKVMMHTAATSVQSLHRRASLTTRIWRSAGLWNAAAGTPSPAERACLVHIPDERMTPAAHLRKSPWPCRRCISAPAETCQGRDRWPVRSCDASGIFGFSVVASQTLPTPTQTSPRFIELGDVPHAFGADRATVWLVPNGNARDGRTGRGAAPRSHRAHRPGGRWLAQYCRSPQDILRGSAYRNSIP